MPAAPAWTTSAPATETISYEIHADDFHSRGLVTLPAWCSGDPTMAVALYFFGERGSAQYVTRAEVVDPDHLKVTCRDHSYPHAYVLEECRAPEAVPARRPSVGMPRRI